MSQPSLDRKSTATHEAGHVAGMLLFGHLPKLTRADWWEPEAYGSTLFPWDDAGRTVKTRMEFMVAVLLGPLAQNQGLAGTPTWPPKWPLRRIPGDEGQLAAAASLLKMTEAQYDEVAQVAIGISETPVWRRLVALIARALEINETLTDRDLRILLGPDRLDELGIPNEPLTNEQE